MCYYFPPPLQSSSCLSDREEEDLYDCAAKYQGHGNQDRQRLNNKLSPSRYVKQRNKAGSSFFCFWKKVRNTKD